VRCDRLKLVRRENIARAQACPPEAPGRNQTDSAHRSFPISLVTFFPDELAHSRLPTVDSRTIRLFLSQTCSEYWRQKRRTRAASSHEGTSIRPETQRPCGSTSVFRTRPCRRRGASQPRACSPPTRLLQLSAVDAGEKATADVAQQDGVGNSHGRRQRSDDTFHRQRRTPSTRHPTSAS
jgi:hypothetical protein